MTKRVASVLVQRSEYLCLAAQRTLIYDQQNQISLIIE